jgi:hypothetical protein
MEALNDNKFFLGIMLLVLNLGSRHLVDEFSASPEEYNRNLILRRFAVFAVCFVGTRDIMCRFSSRPRSSSSRQVSP